jgi:hypothetical protein
MAKNRLNLRRVVVIATCLAGATIFSSVNVKGQVSEGYYLATGLVPHSLTVKNGNLYIEAGSETALYVSENGKYVLKGYYYAGDENNIKEPVSKNPPYIVPKSSTSYIYCALGKEYLYQKSDDPAEMMNRYIQKAENDEDHAQFWVMVGTYYSIFKSITDEQILIQYAKTIRQLAPDLVDNPCPEVIPDVIWKKAK